MENLLPGPLVDILRNFSAIKLEEKYIQAGQQLTIAKK
jgi:hypothetical protein